MDVKTPTLLRVSITHFSDLDNCVSYMVAKRGLAVLRGPTCGSHKVTYDATARRWQCASHHPKRKFSLKTGTVLEDLDL